MFTLTTPSKVAQTAPYRFLIYGPGGAGKTTLAAQSPNPIFIACPANEVIPLAGQDIKVLGCNTWDDLIEAVKIVVKGHEKLGHYETIVLDNMSYIYTKALSKALEEQTSDVISQATWTATNRLITLVLEDLTSSGKNVIIVAHQREETNERTQTTKISPDFGSGLRSRMIGLVDCVFHYRLVGAQRKCRTAAIPGTEAKTRYKMQDEMINPSMETILNHIEKFREATKND